MAEKLKRPFSVAFINCILHCNFNLNWEKKEKEKQAQYTPPPRPAPTSSDYNETLFPPKKPKGLHSNILPEPRVTLP